MHFGFMQFLMLAGSLGLLVFGVIDRADLAYVCDPGMRSLTATRLN